MSITHAFPEKELEERIHAVREEMKKNNLDGIVVTVPENIYYLTGLDHWGYFACHVLFVPLEGNMILICRQMSMLQLVGMSEMLIFMDLGILKIQQIL